MAEYTVPPLPYDFAALEPHIDAKTMEIHHDKHHAAYVTNLNNALKDHPDLQGKPIEELLAELDSVPEAARTAVRNNGGGHANHSLFWKTAQAGRRPASPPAPSPGRSSPSSAATPRSRRPSPRPPPPASARAGPGWSWARTASSPSRRCPNQDSPFMEGQTPSSASTSGNMPTTSSTRTAAPSTSRPSGRDQLGRGRPALRGGQEAEVRPPRGRPSARLDGFRTSGTIRRVGRLPRDAVRCAPFDLRPRSMTARLGPPGHPAPAASAGPDRARTSGR